MNYNERKYSFEPNLTWETEQKINIILELIGTNKKVLDIGAFNGYTSKKIKDNGNDVLAIDISSKAIEMCKQRGIKCLKMDLEKKLRIKDNSFDVIFGGDIIEHIFYTDSLLQELSRILKPDGHLILTTPNLASLTRRIKLLFGVNPYIEIGIAKAGTNSGHIRYFTFGTLKELMERNNFVVEQTVSDFIALHKLRFAQLVKMPIFMKFGYTIIIKAINTK